VCAETGTNERSDRCADVDKDDREAVVDRGDREAAGGVAIDKPQLETVRLRQESLPPLANGGAIE
jgi:hypothetical protein